MPPFLGFLLIVNIFNFAWQLRLALSGNWINGIVVVGIAYVCGFIYVIGIETQALNEETARTLAEIDARLVGLSNHAGSLGVSAESIAEARKRLRLS